MKTYTITTEPSGTLVYARVKELDMEVVARPEDIRKQVIEAIQWSQGDEPFKPVWA